MARKRSARVVLARKALDGVTLAVADGANAVVQRIVEVANPPDATPFGSGLVTRGGWLTYVGGKKIDGGGTDGRQPKKPRAFRPRSAGYIVAMAGFGFPARFQEMGTVHHGSQPFLTPARDAVIPAIPGIVRQAAAYRIARIRK